MTMDIKAELEAVRFVKRDLATFRDIFPHTPFNENTPCLTPETSAYWRLNHLVSRLDVVYDRLAGKNENPGGW